MLCSTSIHWVDLTPPANQNSFRWCGRGARRGTAAFICELCLHVYYCEKDKQGSRVCDKHNKNSAFPSPTERPTPRWGNPLKRHMTSQQRHFNSDLCLPAPTEQAFSPDTQVPLLATRSNSNHKRKSSAFYRWQEVNFIRTVTHRAWECYVPALNYNNHTV